MLLQDKIKKVLANNTLAVISSVTAAGKKPQSALVAFIENDTLELFFQTPNKTRKYRNLTANPNVALVIGFGLTTLQYEGSAEQVIDKTEVENIKQRFDKKGSPSTRQYLDLPDTAFFKVTPRWIGYSDYTALPADVDELTF